MTRACAVVLLALASTGAAASDTTCPEPNVIIRAGVAAPAAEAWLEKELRVAAGKICAWWGASFSGTLNVEIMREDTPSMALVPAWRGQLGLMQFPGPAVQRQRAATVHEVVHVFAPNGNRFLAEGLAVYAHEKLGGPPAYPNFGRDLHRVVQPHAQQTDLATLDALATPAMLGSQGNYLVAGSFVRFLIERSGLETFGKLYALTPLVPRQRYAGERTRWKDIYGTPLEDLAAAWRVQVSPRP